MYWHIVRVRGVIMNSNSIDLYVYIIIALLPLSACMLVFQVNPYHALLLRGVLGAIAALVYAVLGAPDVALTEALVGTLLAITLYAVAVRSSLVMRLGVLENDSIDGEGDPEHLGELIADLRNIFGKRHMRVELVRYTNMKALQRALVEKDVHTTFAPQHLPEYNGHDRGTLVTATQYCTATRVQRLYDIMQAELSSSEIQLTYVSASEENHQ